MERLVCGNALGLSIADADPGFLCPGIGGERQAGWYLFAIFVLFLRRITEVRGGFGSGSGGQVPLVPIEKLRSFEYTARLKP